MTLLIRLEVAITGGIKAAPAPDGVAGQGGACASARRGGNRPGLEFRFDGMLIHIHAHKTEQVMGDLQSCVGRKLVQNVIPACRKASVRNGIADRCQPDTDRIRDLAAAQGVANHLDGGGRGVIAHAPSNSIIFVMSIIQMKNIPEIMVIA